MIASAKNENAISNRAKDEVCVSRSIKIKSVTVQAATGAAVLGGIWKLFGMEYAAFFPAFVCLSAAISPAFDIGAALACDWKPKKKAVRAFAINSAVCAAFAVPGIYAVSLGHNNQMKLVNAEDFLVSKLIDQAKSGEVKPHYCTVLERFWDKKDFFPHAREVCLSGEVNRTVEGAFMLKVNGAEKIGEPVFMVSGDTMVQGKRYVPAAKSQIVNAL